LIETINDLINKNVPLRKVKNDTKNISKKPWITPGISKSIATKNKLYKKFITCKSDIIKSQRESKFKKIRNLLLKTQRHSK